MNRESHVLKRDVWSIMCFCIWYMVYILWSHTFGVCPVMLVKWRWQCQLSGTKLWMSCHCTADWWGFLLGAWSGWFQCFWNLHNWCEILTFLSAEWAVSEMLLAAGHLQTVVNTGEYLGIFEFAQSNTGYYYEAKHASRKRPATIHRPLVCITTSGSWQPHTHI